ncbi:MAG TPA: DNA-formamidopyrimidine glycosylase family protein [Actinomycetota bacterium]|nr:DNA-formamidopyrimidine glycosylase family protein [Actinomycetota bacterium]
MPELPELQAVAERLTETFGGKTLRRVDAYQFSALKTVEPSPFDLGGRVLDGVGRRGKYLVFELGDLRVLVHLSQGGRLDFEDPPRTSKPRGAVARFVFEDGPSLLVKEFGTERKAAWWVLTRGDEGPLADLGPEPFDDAFTAVVDAAADRRQLHNWLRDQKVVAGIGRGFADDVLHEARLSPVKQTMSLTATERTALLDAVRKVLSEATDRERERTGGLPAKMGERFTIHNHYGRPCPRCGATLQHVVYESREVVYCPACQTGGKVLADRVLSQFLK